MEISTLLKKKLHNICMERAQEKIDVCSAVLQKINDAKTSETKSSAGDKFETSREMLQAEEDRTTLILSKAIILKKTLEQIDPDQTISKVENGALVIGYQQYYYISAALGKIQLDGNTYWAISMASPIAKQMRGMSKGDTFIFNGREHHIVQII